MAQSIITGFDEAFKVLDELPNALTRKIINASAVKAIKPVKVESKSILVKHAKGEGEFSRVMFLSRGIVIRSNSRRQPPGARLLILGPDIPVSGRFWTLWKFGKLIALGAYQTPDRKGHGEFKGFGNFILEAADRKGDIARADFERGIVPEMKKAGDRLMKRYGKHGR